MKIYSSRAKANSPHTSRRKRLVHVVVWVLVALFVLWLFGKAIGSATSLVTTPLFVTKSWLSESSATIPSYFRSRGELMDDIDTLRKEISRRSGMQSTVDRLLSENEKFRTLLNIADVDRVAAGVVGRPPSVPYDQLVIDRGRDAGIRENAYVYFTEDYVVGYVSRVYPSSSLVKLFSAPGTVLTVYVIGPDIYTHAYGKGGGVLEITVPQGIALEPGNTVVLPTVVPGILGRVQEVESVATEPEQRGYVLSDLSLQEVRFVAVSERTITETSFAEAQTNVSDTVESLLQIDVPDDVIVDVASTTATSSVPAPATSSSETNI